MTHIRSEYDHVDKTLHNRCVFPTIGEKGVSWLYEQDQSTKKPYCDGKRCLLSLPGWFFPLWSVPGFWAFGGGLRDLGGPK
ncbi:unnamed protein product [Cunninghamella blakesleeana]